MKIIRLIVVLTILGLLAAPLHLAQAAGILALG